MLLQVYSKHHQWHKAIFFDTDEKQYYNARTDIYLDTEDVRHYRLRPVELIDIDNAKILYNEEYFIVWDRSDSIKQQVLKQIQIINSVYPTVSIYDQPAERLAEGIVEICKSLCPTQIWSSQSDPLTKQD